MYTAFLRDVQPTQYFSFITTPKNLMICKANGNNAVETIGGKRFDYLPYLDTEQELGIYIHNNPSDETNEARLYTLINTNTDVRHAGYKDGSIICSGHVLSDAVVVEKESITCKRCLRKLRNGIVR